MTIFGSFALDSIFTITGLTPTPQTVRLGDHHAATRAKLSFEARFPTGTSLDPSALSRTLELDVGMGVKPYSGSVAASSIEWKKITDKEWKLKLHD